MVEVTLTHATESKIELDSLAHAETLRDRAIDSGRAMEIVASLTTEIGPRLAGSAAEARARDWAVRNLSGMGFTRTRVETFEMTAWQRLRESAAVVSPFPQPLRVAALGGSVSTPVEGLMAPIRVFENLDALKQAPHGSLEGLIAYVGHAMQSTQDGSSYAYFNEARTKGPSIAAERGALAYLLRSIGTDSRRLPHTGSLAYLEETRKIPAFALSNPDADQIERINEIKRPILVELMLDSNRLSRALSGNVITEIIGREAPNEIVLIGAHLDSWDLGTGAVDDGAGVGITMAALELIKNAGYTPRRTIRLVLWGAEEVGLLGAKAYRSKHLEELPQHIIGSESDFGGGRVWKVTADSETDEGDLLFRQLTALLAPIGIVPGSDNQKGGGPDMVPLIAEGMPSLRLHQDGRDYFDLHHTADDTLDKLDSRALDQNVAAFAVFAWLVADSNVYFREAEISP